jgi:hypothetical protein
MDKCSGRSSPEDRLVLCSVSSKMEAIIARIDARLNQLTFNKNKDTRESVEPMDVDDESVDVDDDNSCGNKGIQHGLWICTVENC